MPLTTTTISLLLGFLGSVLFIVSCFSIHRKRILVFGMAASIVLIVGYAAKSDITAAAMVICALSRNVLFLIEGAFSHPRFTRRTVGFIMLPTVAIIWLATEWNGFQLVSLLILLGPLLLTVGFILPSVSGLKVFTIFNGISWLTYEFLTGAYTVMLGEFVGLCMAILALYRLSRKKHISFSQAMLPISHQRKLRFLQDNGNLNE
jgi:hypothetical protein